MQSSVKWNITIKINLNISSRTLKCKRTKLCDDNRDLKTDKKCTESSIYRLKSKRTHPDEDNRLPYNKPKYSHKSVHGNIFSVNGHDNFQQLNAVRFETNKCKHKHVSNVCRTDNSPDKKYNRVKFIQKGPFCSKQNTTRTDSISIHTDINSGNALTDCKPIDEDITFVKTIHQDMANNGCTNCYTAYMEFTENSADNTKDDEERNLEDELVQLAKENENLRKIYSVKSRKQNLKLKIAKLKEENRKLKIETYECTDEEITLGYDRTDFEAKKAFVEEHYHLIPPCDRTYFDVMILYNSDVDNNAAEQFRLHLENDFKYIIKVVLYDGPEVETLYALKFTSLEECFNRSTLKFIFLTDSFIKNDWTRLCSEACLDKALYGKKHEWSIVPIYTHPNIKAPFGLNSITGFLYYNKTHPSYVKSMDKKLEQCVAKRISREKDLILKYYAMIHCIIRCPDNTISSVPID